jgi:hypothetical protein
MTPFVSAESNVLHIEVDVTHSNQLVFSDDHSLKITDGNVTSKLVGSATSPGYVEGVGDAARFNRITGFLQINVTDILVVDAENHCLRIVNRLSRETSPFVGQCQVSGFRDGVEALFNYPFSVIRDTRSLVQVLVTDHFNNALRIVNMNTRVTSTLISQVNEFYRLKVAAFDCAGENLIITHNHYVSKFNLKSKTLVEITGSRNYGFSDGSLNQARFYWPYGLFPLSDSVTLVADNENSRMRIINKSNDSVSSICTGARGSSDGSSSTCTLDRPRALHVHHGVAYIGQYQAIRKLLCRSL